MLVTGGGSAGIFISDKIQPVLVFIEKDTRASGSGAHFIILSSRLSLGGDPQG